MKKQNCEHIILKKTLISYHKKADQLRSTDKQCMICVVDFEHKNKIKFK